MDSLINHNHSSFLLDVENFTSVHEFQLSLGSYLFIYIYFLRAFCFFVCTTTRNKWRHWNEMVASNKQWYKEKLKEYKNRAGSGCWCIYHSKTARKNQRRLRHLKNDNTSRLSWNWDNQKLNETCALIMIYKCRNTRTLTIKERKTVNKLEGEE